MAILAPSKKSAASSRSPVSGFVRSKPKRFVRCVTRLGFGSSKASSNFQCKLPNFSKPVAQKTDGLFWWKHHGHLSRQRLGGAGKLRGIGPSKQAQLTHPTSLSEGTITSSLSIHVKLATTDLFHEISRPASGHRALFLQPKLSLPSHVKALKSRSHSTIQH